jgi:hypothetical protein
MQRKSSVHFKPVTNIKFAVSHSERTELSEPGYLLPKKHQLPNIVVAGSLSETDLAELFIKQKEAMTGQAKARGSSPFWEGVVVLGNTDAQEQSANLLDWKKAYEQTTGHKVLHMSIHLDEGYIDKAGNPEYNPHAHVIVSRMNEKNRIIKLERKELAAIQDLTAETLKMERGSTLKERGGKRGREHIPHNIFREMANGHRVDLEKETNRKNDYANWLDYKNNQYDLEKEKNKEANKIIAEKYEEIERLKLEHKAEVEKLRTELKASGEAKQADYQRLQKLSKEWSDEDFFKIEKLQAQLDREPARLAAALAAQKAHLDEQYKLDREEFKRLNAEAAAAGLEKVKSQRDYQDLKVKHEAALANLTKAQTEAGKVPTLVEQVNALKPKAERVQGLEQDLAKAKTEAGKVPNLMAQVNTLKPKADRVQGLEQDLTKAQTEADKVPNLVAQVNTLKPKADRVQGLEQDLAKAKTEADKVAALVAQVNALKPQAGRVPDLERDLSKAQQQAKQVPGLEQQAAQQAQELAQLKTQYQRDYQQLKQQHETTQQEAINTKLTADERYKHLRGQALVIKDERDELAKKVLTLTRAAAPQPAPPAQPAAPAQTLAPAVQAPAPRPVPRPTPALAVQAPTLAERLAKSLQRLLDWIKGQGGVLKEINTEKADCYGAVVQLDDLHAVQRVGRGTYAIHQLDKLDKVPTLDDPKTEISYRGGRGTVVGQGYGHGLGSGEQ